MIPPSTALQTDSPPSVGPSRVTSKTSVLTRRSLITPALVGSAIRVGKTLVRVREHMVGRKVSEFFPPKFKNNHRQVVVKHLGKIREMTTSEITITLFTDDGDIQAVFERKQVVGNASIGKIVEYIVEVRPDGKTEVTVRAVKSKILSEEEIERIRKRVETDLPETMKF